MKQYKFWFVTGSQHLYGPAVLDQVKQDAKEMVTYMNAHMASEYEIVWKDTVKTKAEITSLFKEANNDDDCAGVITWMHTFSPSKMWINGLRIINKPLLHLHTQFNKEIPWDQIDMNFMNTNQSAHGDREHGFIHSRMKTGRKVVVGYYQKEEVLDEISRWQRVAVAASESKLLKIARFGDNMRSVAVTEGDKVEAEIKLGWTVDYYGVGDLVAYVDAVTDEAVNQRLEELKEKYILPVSVLESEDQLASVRYQIREEIAIRKFLEEKGCMAYTNTFEDLHGLKQLPGLASQSLMAEGYGFGPEGDWKVAAMIRLIKIMSGNKGTSLMEDYTYHMTDDDELILGAHMLEICPTLSEDKATIEVHPLGIGGKNPPARLVFEGKEGPAVCVSLVDMGGRLRLIVLDVEAMKVPQDMPNLPVARVMWKPLPDFKTGTKAWLLAGGAHHTVFSYDVNAEDMMDFARIMDIECVHIGKDTEINRLEQELMVNDLVWKLK